MLLPALAAFITQCYQFPLHIVFKTTSFSPWHKSFAGPGDLPGLTDDDKPRMRGPKRASKIRKLFNLTKDDDVRKYVNTYRRSFEGKDGKTHSKAPKIQRLVTPLTLQRKRRRASLNRQRHEKVRLCLTLATGCKMLYCKEFQAPVFTVLFETILIVFGLQAYMSKLYRELLSIPRRLF